MKAPRGWDPMMSKLLEVLEDPVPEGLSIKAVCPVCRTRNLYVLPPHNDKHPTFVCRKEGCNWSALTHALVDRGVPKDIVRISIPGRSVSGEDEDPEERASDDRPPLPALTDLMETGVQRLLDDKRFRTYVRRELGLSTKQITEFSLGLLHMYGAWHLSLPVWDENWALQQVRLVNPFMKDKRQRKKWIFGRGAKHLFGAELLPLIPVEEPVVLCEGETDYLVLRSLGVHVVGAAGALMLPDDLSPFVGRLVLVCFDNDSTGRGGATKAARRLAEAGAVVWVLNIAQHVPTEGGDLRDWVVKQGATRQDILDWIEKAMVEDPLSSAEAAEEVAIDSKAKERLRQIVANERAESENRQRKLQQAINASTKPRNVDGGSFVFDTTSNSIVYWGSGDHVLAIEGETTYIVGGDGIGKTTIAQQYMGYRLGLLGSTDLGSGMLKGSDKPSFLGYPVAPLPAHQKALYFAMDRPDQAARSMARMFDAESHREELTERLKVWRGPLPIDVLSSPQTLADWVLEQYGPDVGLVVIDSLKDLAPNLADGAVGQGVNSAVQEFIARGIEVVVLHHPRKPQERGQEPGLTDVYGSRWLYAGVGSAFMLLGDAGDAVVEMSHVKQVRGVVPRLLLEHDHAYGRTRRKSENVTPAQALQDAGAAGLTKVEGAKAVYGSDEKRLLNKVERAFNGMVERDEAETSKGSRGGPATRWWAKGLRNGVE